MHVNLTRLVAASLAGAGADRQTGINRILADWEARLLLCMPWLFLAVFRRFVWWICAALCNCPGHPVIGKIKSPIASRVFGGMP